MLFNPYVLLFVFSFGCFAANDTAQTLLNVLYPAKQAKEFPSDNFSLCGAHYKSYVALKKHIISAHPGSMAIEGHTVTDTVHGHTSELIKFLLLKRCLDWTMKMGHGDYLSLLMKHFMLYFRQLGCTKYALACFEHVAQQQLFLSERMKVLIRQECFVNNLGRRDSNMPMDLDLEHSNKVFKEHFTLSRSEPSEKCLARLSLAQDCLQEILINFYNQFQLEDYQARRQVSKSKYDEDVNKLVKHLKPSNVFMKQTGRRHYSEQLRRASHDPLVLVEMYDLKQWMANRLKIMQDQIFLQK